MEKQTIIQDIIFPAINSVNQLITDENKIHQDVRTRLNPFSGNLDSMTFINLIVELEKNINQKLGRHINLSNEKVISSTPDPFENVDSLANKIVQLMNNN